MKALVHRSLFFLALLAPLHAADEKKLVVHEWGTFTSLQDEAGLSIGGVNTDDEPVPKFVRRLSSYFFLSRSEAPPIFFQGTPQCHPDVTMRLETPVLYFYPPDGWRGKPFDVHVGFNGGWLTEYYPTADAKAPGFDATSPDQPFLARAMRWLYYSIDHPNALPPTDGPLPARQVSSFGHLRGDAQGELVWKGVKLGIDGAGPETQDKVWLAPRAVKSAMLETALGEKEKFLFYRGVAHANASLRIVRKAETLEIHNAPAKGQSSKGPASELIAAAWLLEVRGDGTCAFRTIGELPIKSEKGDTLRGTMPAAFAADDFGKDRLAKLQDEMRAGLIKAGLFADEADALLRTWEISYFKSPGTRFFYLCSSLEIEQLLPLKISTPSEITRVMVGRIELVTPEQRALLAKIAAGPAEELWKMRGVTGDSQSDFFKNPENTRRWNAVMEGSLPYKSLADLGLTIPPLYADYLALGRFRNALLLDEEKRRPTEALKAYIKTNNFSAYEVQEKPDKP